MEERLGQEWEPSPINGVVKAFNTFAFVVTFQNINIFRPCKDTELAGKAGAIGDGCASGDDINLCRLMIAGAAFNAVETE